jgi:dipeptidase D
MSILSNLEPYNVFKYFEEICAIPHGSGNTLAISNYLVDFAQEHNLRYIQDNANNVIIFKEGTTGYEQSPAVMLQGHMDMVAVKDNDCDIDMEHEGLRLKVENGIISAEGTSLGGDDGIACAYALAILASDDIPHPPIEAVFTVDEEIGMLGATALDCSPLTSRIMLNIDSEDEGYLLVSCAGGATAICNIPVEYQPVSNEYTSVTVHVNDAAGGHSGVEINKQSANASKVLGRFLYSLNKSTAIRIFNIEGGLKDNAIPVEAQAQLYIKKADISLLEDTISDFNKIITHEYMATDKNINVSYEKSATVENNLTNNASTETTTMAMTLEATTRILTALMNYPNGVQKMSADLEGLVQTSLNLGIMNTHIPSMEYNHSTNTYSRTANECHNDSSFVPLAGTGSVDFSFSVRSSISTEKEYLIEQLESLTTALGGAVEIQGEYPAWEYRKDSPLRSLMVKIFTEQYGREPVIQALHAGVECGIFSSRLPGLDCVSYGPDMTDIHTTNESMDAASVKRTWEYTLAILKELK